MRSFNKYNDLKFRNAPSKLESALGDMLRQREFSGEIKNILTQQTVVLQEGKQNQRITWRVDYSYVECESEEVCLAEAKGFATDVYKLKLKLYRANPKFKRLEIWGGSYKSLKLIEVIER